MKHIAKFMLLALGLGIAAAPQLAEARSKRPKVKVAPKPKAPVITAENKKAMLELMGAFTFGMDKDAVIAVLSKQIDEAYAERITGTTDIAAQDRLRREKGAEVARIRKSFVVFDGKRTGWDVSLIEDQFAHNTNESMLVFWENQGGKNQRRFFFFADGKLYKMFISLDTSKMAVENLDFATFKTAMEGRFGPGLSENDRIYWRPGDFWLTAVDKLKAYDALCLVIGDTKVTTELDALRAERAPAKKQMNAVVRQVLEPAPEAAPVTPPPPPSKKR